MKKRTNFFIINENMKKSFRLIILFSLITPLLFACYTNGNSSSNDVPSNNTSSTSDIGVSSPDTDSITGESSVDSTSEYQGVDGYQYEVIEYEANYWYNTGTALPIGVNYHNSNLLDNLKRGDIIFEAAGFYGITGHVAIVEGIYYSDTYEQYYVRIIEAISVGVARSILTPTRIIEKIGSAYRVKDANETQIDNAIAFIIAQLGKPYQVEYAKSYSPDSPNWYCSELIWAAYYHQGINLDDENLDSPVTPRDTIENNFVESITI